jgi:ADP-ribose pyrophosphatase YjhB (NUDIX family)
MKNEPIYKTEKEFLENYNPDQFEKLSMTVDILIFSVSSSTPENYRKLPKKNFSILLVKRDNHPFKDKWCLPGGFIGIEENLEDAARRILSNETNLHNVYLEQLYTFGEPSRDPRMRIVSTSYIALVDKSKLDEELLPTASWFDISLEERDGIMDIELNNGEESINIKVKKELKHQTSSNYNYTIVENDKIAFDHPLVISTGIDRLKSKIEYTDIVFNMMSEHFSLGELQQVHEAILGKELLAPAFRRIIKDKVVKTDLIKKGRGHRPSVLYRYKGRG